MHVSSQHGSEQEAGRANKFSRLEFFFATPAEVRAALLEKDGGLLEFHENPEAPEYFQSVGHWPADLDPRSVT